MENRRGSGIFLGVVSVATLIVAIIGATFAYFSASVEGEGTVDLTAYEFNASVSISPVYPTSAASLIPLNPNTALTGENITNKTNITYAMNEATNRCVDSYGYQVCAVYKAVFTNNGSADIELDGVLTTAKNNVRTSATEEDIQDGKATGFTNLKFSHLTGTETGNDFALTGDLIDIKSTVDESADIGSVSVGAGETETIYFVVYLNEAGELNNPEMGASFQGELTYTSATGGQQLTGTFNVGGTEQPTP